MEQKQAIADRLKQSNNILLTVSTNPSVDQLAACIGLTLALNKLGKHASAVFSGTVPSTLEFLQPEKTIEKNTDSLRDFIISLDKSKADKLRYKVEDKVVKIFITPYKTSISDKDLEFSQGDFNVDVVLALGVHQQQDLDQAITSHGRILHDAVVATINTKPGGELGTINWLEPLASSLSELGAELLEAVDKTVLDGQMATAFLTGIVAETDRFSNEKTSPTTMSISAELMAAGANQQLVATKLEQSAIAPVPPATPAAPVRIADKSEGQHEDIPRAEDGTLEIGHTGPGQPLAEQSQPAQGAPQPAQPATKPWEPPVDQVPATPLAMPVELPPLPPANPIVQPQIHIDDHGALQSLGQHTDATPSHHDGPLLAGSAGPTTDPTQHMASSHMILQPPAMGGQLSASGLPEDENTADPLSLPEPHETGFGGSFGQGLPTASASIAPPAMPFLPPSMTPGASLPPAPIAQPAPAQAPQIITPQPQPATQPSVFAPPAAPGTLAVPAAPPPALAPPEPPGETLSEIEADVNSPHLQGGAAAPPADSAAPDLASARDAVLQAISGGPLAPGAPEPITALNAQPLGAPLHENESAPPAAPAATNFDATANPTFTLPDAPLAPGSQPAPPAVPPPMMPPNFG